MNGPWGLNWTVLTTKNWRLLDHSLWQFWTVLFDASESSTSMQITVQFGSRRPSWADRPLSYLKQFSESISDKILWNSFSCIPSPICEFTNDQRKSQGVQFFDVSDIRSMGSICTENRQLTLWPFLWLVLAWGSHMGSSSVRQASDFKTRAANSAKNQCWWNHCFFSASH